jgi:hypothetical protein
MYSAALQQQQLCQDIVDAIHFLTSMSNLEVTSSDNDDDNSSEVSILLTSSGSISKCASTTGSNAAKLPKA